MKHEKRPFEIAFPSTFTSEKGDNHIVGSFWSQQETYYG